MTPAEAEHPQRQRPRINADGERVYRVQGQGTQDDFNRGSSYRIPVPADVARLIGPDAEFVLEVTDEGLLYRKVSGETRGFPDMPEWIR